MIGISLDQGIGIGIGGPTLSGVQAVLASAGFFAPLTKSLVLQQGTGLPSYTRPSAAIVQTYDGVKTALSGEARFTGARRVANLLAPNTENVGDTTTPTGHWVYNWSGTNSTVVPNDLSVRGISLGKVTTNGDGEGIYYRTTAVPVANGAYQNSIFVYSSTSQTLQLIISSSGGAAWGAGAIAANVLVPANTLVRLSLPATAVSSVTATSVTIGVISQVSAGGVGTGAVFWVGGIQLENVTNQANQNPSEYVSNGVLAAPYHGAGVDGVQYFDYANGNTVSNNVVTEAQGAAIPAATLEGYLSEGTATNYFLNSGAPVTQTISLPTGTFTVGNILGTGTITSSAGTATASGYGIASASATNTITVTVAGTVVFTVAGTVTQAQMESGAEATSYIATVGTAVARAADSETLQSTGNALATSGTMYAEVIRDAGTTSGAIFVVNDSSFNNAVEIIYTSSGTIRATFRSGGAVQADIIGATTLPIGTPSKIAASWIGGYFNLYVNGVKQGQTLTGIAPANFTVIGIGLRPGNIILGRVTTRNSRIWQTQLPDTTLQAITTP